MSAVVSINILNYNGGEDILHCLASLRDLTYRDFRIIVIDNHSTDTSVAALTQQFPEVTLLRNPSNIGFGAGHQIGIDAARQHGAQFVWLLNQDAHVEPQSLTHLLAALETNSDTAAVSPLILRPDHSIWFAGGHIDWLRMRATHAHPHPLPTQPFETAYLTGCAPLYRMTALQTLERPTLFDARYFLYYEDADLSLRLHAKGYRLRVAPEARVWHAETSQKALPQKTYHLVLSGLIFFHNHARGFWRLWYRIYIPLRRLKNRLDCFFHPSPIHHAVARAYADFYLHHR
jgi:GT2 family glycosyltransferase